MSPPALQVFNTLTRAKEPFVPGEPPLARVYSCGPTVYDAPHIGNFRFFVWVDVLHRVLRSCGFDVRLVMNITDVDDKTIAGARREGMDLRAFTERHSQEFFDGLKTLQVLPAAEYPRATDHIEDMVALIERLLAGGHAYQVEGNVFFRVASFPQYGKLARLDPDQMQATERVESDAFGKRDPRDFTLWKAAKPGEPRWQAPFGAGRPGWHLECSAMSMRYLGESFDMHLGGTDLIFPHHENEIAQSEAATGRPLARYWLHCNHLVVDGSKMSKSVGNCYTLADLADRGYDPVALRYLFASVHYRRPLNFTFAALEQAQASVDRLRELTVRIEQSLQAGPGGAATAEALAAALARARTGFTTDLADDVNIAGALGHVFTLVRETNTALDRGQADERTLQAIGDWLRGSVDSVLAVLGPSELRELRIEQAGTVVIAVGPPLGSELEDCIVQRVRARLERDFATADALRDRLSEAGIALEDTPEGVRWRRAR